MNLQVTSRTQTADRVSVSAGQAGARRRARRGVRLALWVAAVITLLAATPAASLAQGCSSCAVSGSSCEKVKVGFAASVCSSSGYSVTLDGRTAMGAGSCTANSWVTTPLTEVELTIDKPVKLVAGTDSCSTHVVFNVPKGYKLLVDGVETKTVDKGGTAKGSGDGTWEVVVRKCDECEQNENVETCDLSVGSINWSVSLGKLSDGRSAQALSLREDFLSAAIYTPAALTYSPPRSGEVDVVRNADGSLRQIKVPRAFGDVVVISQHEYEVRFYDPANVGPKSGGLYTVSGQPFLTWRFKNPDPSTVSRLQLSEVEGGVTTTYEYRWDAITNTWALDEGAGARVETKTVARLTDTSWIETTVLKDAAGQVVSKVARTFHSFPWGDEMLEVVIDPEGAALKTVYAYYENSAEAGRYRRLKSVVFPNGSWEKYDYDANGNQKLVLRPWKDLALSAATEANSHATYLTYSNSDGISASPYPYLVSSVTQKIEGVVVGKTTYTRAGTQVGGEPATVETETAYSSASATLSTIVTKYHATASPHLANKIVSVVRPDGTKDTYTYEKGNFVTNADPALSQFTPDPAGAAWRETVVRGTVGSPDGVALKTTKETIVRGQHGHVALTEVYVYTGAGYERVGWTASDYDARGNLTRARHHNGEVMTATWDGHRMASSTDASGVETVYTYDALGRVKTETRKGVAAGGGYPAQPDQITTYTYDAENRVIGETLTGGGSGLSRSVTFDGAGRVKTETNTAGLTTIHEYLNGGRTHVITYPGGATQTADAYLDGQAKSATGTAGVARHNDYGVDADGTQFTHEFSGPAGLGSPRRMKTTTDWMGRVVRVESPGFAGTTTTVTNTFNGKGQLVSQTASSGANRLGADVLTEYDALGRQVRHGLDLDANGTFAPLSADRYKENESSFQQEGNDWFDRVAVATYLADNDDTRTELRVRRQRLNNFPANGAEATVSEVRTTNEAGQTTVAYRSINRAAKRVTVTVDVPESNVDAVNISVNDMSQSSSPATPQAATTFAYDGLGRPTGATTPQGGAVHRSYHNTTGQLLSEGDAVQTTTYEYYPTTHPDAGRLKSRTNAQSKKTYFGYDGRGELARTWGDAVNPVEYVYDDYGQRAEMRTYRGGSNWGSSVWPAATAGAADVTRWIYHEPTGLLERKRDAAGREVAYAYDALARLAVRTWARLDASGGPLTATHSYDPLTGDLAGVNYSDATPDVTFAYDRGGRARTITDAAGTRSRTYNARGDLRAELIAGGILDMVQTNTPFDAFLRRQSAEAARGANVLVSQTYGYDYASRLGTVTSGGQTVTYGYNPESGLLANTSYTGGTTVGRSYTSLGRTQNVTTTPAADAAQSYTYTYNNLHQRTRVTREDGSYWAYGYNDRGELASGKKFWSDNTPVFGRQTEYAFDNAGNRTAARAGGNQLGELRQSVYSANSLNQYTQRTVPGAADVAGTAHAAATVTVNNEPAARRGDYFYKEMAVANGAGPAYAPVNVVGARNNFGAGGEDAVTEKGGRVFVPQAVEGYGYDADGNLTFDGRWNYAWDAENRLTVMEARPNVPADARLRLEFAYDWSGRRIEKKVYAWSAAAGGYQPQSVARFVYDGWNLLAELDGAGALVRSYVWGQDLSGSLEGAGGVGGLLLVRQGGAVYQAGYDAGGNVTTLVDAATGRVAASYDYDAFGNTLKAVGEFAASNPFRFSTKYADAETGLVYYGERFYEPQTGRWLSRDPLGEDAGLNLYQFVSNNPVGLIDPTGLYEEDVHYYLTYFLAMQVGCFDSKESRWIADANQKADEDDDKEPATGHGIIGRALGPFTSVFPIPFTEEDNRARARHRTYHALTEPEHHDGNVANLMRDTALPSPCTRDKRKQKENDKARQQKLRNFGTVLHYTQDMFSHRGYTSDNVGHGIEALRLGQQHMPDKTHGRGFTPITQARSFIPLIDRQGRLRFRDYSRVDRAREMVMDTWNRMKEWCKANECFGSPEQLKQQQRNFDTALPLIMDFLNSNGSPRRPDGSFVNPDANPNGRSINPQEMDIKRQILRVPPR